MTRSVFLLIVGLYTALVALAMIFAPEAALKNYGIPIGSGRGVLA